MPEPWWTDADDAELALLVEAFVDGAFEHRERCVICSGNGVWCDPVREAFEMVQEWRRSRSLRSKAIFLRALQSLRDLNTKLPQTPSKPG